MILISRNVIHLNRVQLPQYRVNNVVDTNQELRIKYMRNELTIESFKARIHRDNKKYEMNREIHDILTMFIQTVTDIIYRALDVVSTGRELFKLVNAYANFGFVDNAENDAAKKNAEATKKAAEEIEIKTLRIFEEIEPIRNYANECLAEIAKTYGLTQKHIVPFTDKNVIDVLVTSYPKVAKAPKEPTPVVA
jgi:hypothetical protein